MSEDFFQGLTRFFVLAGDRPALLDIAIYHCQQAAEKALKGYLVHRDKRVEKTHDVGLLLERAMQVEPLFRTWRDTIAFDGKAML